MPILTQSLTLEDLPPSPTEKTGWCWQSSSQSPNSILTDCSRYPLISIITPSYNQAEFLEETIRSILLQGYPHLEYIIIDGGSTDGSTDIIQKYAPYLAYWVSEGDRGQSDALNKGFKRATGELIGWQNSDDTYQPNALAYAAKIYLSHPETEVIYGLVHHIDRDSQFLEQYPVTTATVDNMIPYSAVTNHSVFYTAKIFQDGNFIDTNLQHCMDQEFILRLLLKQYKFIFEPQIIGNWRLYDLTKSSQQMDIWAREAFQLCQQVYENETCDRAVRDKAKICLYGLCLDNFSKGRVKVFQDTVAELIKIFGWQTLASGLGLKYGLSWLGEENLKQLLELKAKIYNRMKSNG
ncbi:MAG: glycosyltransferase [Cyanobacteria bacterium SBLK]|nr:glycosyltransferase [Cyanobacteria bacterium SBLK]